MMRCNFLIVLNGTRTQHKYCWYEYQYASDRRVNKLCYFVFIRTHTTRKHHVIDAVGVYLIMRFDSKFARHMAGVNAWRVKRTTITARTHSGKKRATQHAVEGVIDAQTNAHARTYARPGNTWPSAPSLRIFNAQQCNNMREVDSCTRTYDWIVC